MYNKFAINEKRELAREVLNLLEAEEIQVKERFEDLVLGAEVIRVPITIGEKYAGRDLIIVKDMFKEPEKCSSNELKVSYASYTYKTVKNEQIVKITKSELDDVVESYDFKEKKESITDYSCLFTFGDKLLLIRNSYIPSRAIKIALGIKKRIPIPVIEIRIIHTDKGLSKLNLKEKLEKLTKAEPVIEELDNTYFKEVIPEETLAEIELFKHKKIRYVSGGRIDESAEIGKDLLKEAEREHYSGLKLIEEFLSKVYRTNIYVLKRKADNIVLNAFNSIIQKVFA